MATVRQELPIQPLLLRFNIFIRILHCLMLPRYVQLDSINIPIRIQRLNILFPYSLSLAFKVQLPRYNLISIPFCNSDPL